MLCKLLKYGKYLLMFSMAFVFGFLLLPVLLSIMPSATTKESPYVQLTQTTQMAQDDRLDSNTFVSADALPKADTRKSALEWQNIGKFRITAYCACRACCGQYANNRPKDKDGNDIVYTANGSIAEAGYTVAADTSILPFGTTVRINGHVYQVQDRGGAIKGHRIDIYYEDHHAASDFGVQYISVYTRLSSVT